MTPLYFGAPQKPLFGVYHPPQVRPACEDGVVLCYPMGQEYLCVHRAFRQLAIRLARAGFGVLRFDYYGCGDSSGESDEGDIDQWRQDIAVAIDTLKERGGVTQVALVGLRLGATLAALVGTQRHDLTHLVLWEPIVNGKNYIDASLTLHQNWQRDVLSTSKPAAADHHQLEVLGFPLTERVCQGLEAINLLALRQRPARHILIVENEAETSTGGLQDGLKSLDVHVHAQHIPGPQIWMKETGWGTALVPGPTLQAIVSWLAEGCS